MREISKKFPEIKSSLNSSDVPWEDSVVWIVRNNSAEEYNWVISQDIRYVSWTNGIISVIPHPNSILSNYFHSLIIAANEVFIGKNVKTGN